MLNYKSETEFVFERRFVHFFVIKLMPETFSYPIFDTRIILFNAYNVIRLIFAHEK